MGLSIAERSQIEPNIQFAYCLGSGCENWHIDVIRLDMYEVLDRFIEKRS